MQKAGEAVKLADPSASDFHFYLEKDSEKKWLKWLFCIKMWPKHY